MTYLYSSFFNVIDVAEYSREQKNQLSRAIANNGSGSKQLISFVDNRQNILQCIQMAGAYKDTRKSDAHHMPSARAIAAIIMAGIALKTSSSVSTDASEYHTLTNSTIYGGAPAVWMPHGFHARTRTYGGYSTGSLQTDMGIITGNEDSDNKFDKIQQTDIVDYNRIVNGFSVKEDVSNSTDFVSASTATKSNIKNAITRNKDVCKGGSKETFTTTDIAHQVIAIDDFLIKGISLQQSVCKGIRLNRDTKAEYVGMPGSTYSELVRDCKGGNHRNVSRDVARSILDYFDKVVKHLV